MCWRCCSCCASRCSRRARVRRHSPPRQTSIICRPATRRRLHPRRRALITDCRILAPCARLSRPLTFRRSPVENVQRLHALSRTDGFHLRRRRRIAPLPARRPQPQADDADGYCHRGEPDSPAADVDPPPCRRAPIDIRTPTHASLLPVRASGCLPAAQNEFPPDGKAARRQGAARRSWLQMM